MINKPTKNGRAVIRRNALAVALAVGLGLTGGAAIAQSTQGQIFGHAPAASGQTIQIKGESGAARTATINADGSYLVRGLPVGKYTVSLMDNGSVVSTRTITVTPGGGSEVDFAGSSQNAQELAAMQVSASALPPIDVKSVASSYTVDAAELDRLPVGRSAESIALLSPGVVAGSGYFGNVVTVAGAGATENAYYVNGYNTTALYDYSGSAYQLPYNTIAAAGNHHRRLRRQVWSFRWWRDQPDRQARHQRVAFWWPGPLGASLTAQRCEELLLPGCPAAAG